MMPTRFEDKRLDRLASISIAQLRWWGKDLKQIVRKRGLGDDILQALYLAAVEGWRDGLNPDRLEDVKEMRRRAQRAIYACITSYGLRRVQGALRYDWPEIPVSTPPRIGGFAPWELARAKRRR